MIEKVPPTPPDGGWGWMVVLASFMIHVIADGVAYTFGLFFVEISKDLGSSKSSTAWIASIMAGVTYGAGPLASAFVNKYGCRTVSIAGSIIAAIGFAISTFANSVIYLYFSVGLVGGLGLGLIYLPAIVSVTCYFEKRRAFATGIAVCGSGIGTMALAPLLKMLIVKLAWRNAFVVTGGIILVCTIFSLAFKPVKVRSSKQEKDENEGEEKESEKTALAPVTAVVQNKPGLPDIVEPDGQVGSGGGGGGGGENNGAEMSSVKYLYFAAPDTMDASAISLASPDRKKVTEVNSSTLQVTNQPSETLTMSCSQPALPVGIGSMESLNRYSTLQGKKRHSLKMPFQSTGNFNNSESGDVRRRYKHFQSSVINNPGLILERKDIFYSGSLMKIPDFSTLQEEKSSLDSHDDHPDNNNLDVDDDEPLNFQTPKKICGCFKCSPQFYAVLTAMLRCNLLKDPVFLIFAISNFLTSIGYNVPYIYLVDMANEAEIYHSTNSTSILMDSTTGATESASFFGTEYLLSIVGIANTISRVLLGYLSDKKCVNRLWLYNFALIACGIATGIVSHTKDMTMFRVYSGVFGALIGVYVSLTSVILVDLLGLEKLTNAFGLLLLFQGIASVIGPPIVGSLFDEFKDYRSGFWLAGGTMALSGLMLFCIPCLQRRDHKKKVWKAKEDYMNSKALVPNVSPAKKITNNNIDEV